MILHEKIMHFPYLVQALACDFRDQGKYVYTGEWQSQRDGDNPFFHTIELQHVSFEYTMPSTQDILADEVKPNLPWADLHFAERISGIPHNPPPSHEVWPFARKDNDEHRREQGKFDHTYPERFWPKRAGALQGREDQPELVNGGIRFPYGDLSDVITLLSEQRHTRQAYLPIWFPEDTGSVGGMRVPCTLGYHFMIRDGWLDITYYMRSCDFLRHFPDDVYMACRLAQEVAGHVWLRSHEKVTARKLMMHISSLHIFRGPDEDLVKRMTN